MNFEEESETFGQTEKQNSISFYDSERRGIQEIRVVNHKRNNR